MDKGFERMARGMTRAWIVSEILTDVRKEIDRAENQHPNWPTDLLRQVMVVSEEMGEVQQAALNYVEFMERAEKHEPTTEAGEVARHSMMIDEEMIQVAAMALRFLYNRRVNRDRA